MRNDLKLPKGKLCVQIAHASITSFLEAQKFNKEWVEKWLNEGQKKIIVKVDTLDDLLTLKKMADDLGIPSAIISDAGLTVLPPGTITCLGLGPAPDELIDKVTGKLKLL